MDTLSYIGRKRAGTQGEFGADTKYKSSCNKTRGPRTPHEVPTLPSPNTHTKNRKHITHTLNTHTKEMEHPTPHAQFPSRCRVAHRAKRHRSNALRHLSHRITTRHRMERAYQSGACKNKQWSATSHGNRCSRAYELYLYLNFHWGRRKRLGWKSCYLPGSLPSRSLPARRPSQLPSPLLSLPLPSHPL